MASSQAFNYFDTTSRWTAYAAFAEQLQSFACGPITFFPAPAPVWQSIYSCEPAYPSASPFTVPNEEQYHHHDHRHGVVDEEHHHHHHHQQQQQQPQQQNGEAEPSNESDDSYLVPFGWPFDEGETVSTTTSPTITITNTTSQEKIAGEEDNFTSFFSSLRISSYLPAPEEDDATYIEAIKSHTSTWEIAGANTLEIDSTYCGEDSDDSDSDSDDEVEIIIEPRLRTLAKPKPRDPVLASRRMKHAKSLREKLLRKGARDCWIVAKICQEEQQALIQRQEIDEEEREKLAELLEGWI